MAAASTFSLTSCDLQKTNQSRNQLILIMPKPFIKEEVKGSRGGVINLIDAKRSIDEEKAKTDIGKPNLILKGTEHNFHLKIQKDNGTWFSTKEKTIDKCIHPEYMVFSWILCLIALNSALKLYFLVKFFMASSMVSCFAILILFVFTEDFNRFSYEEEKTCLGIPLAAQMLVLLGTFLVMVTYHARLVEVTSRLDFIWNFICKYYIKAIKTRQDNSSTRQDKD